MLRNQHLANPIKDLTALPNSAYLKKFSVLVAFLALSCNVQKENLEDKIMDCVYQGYEDKGKAFKNQIYKYEELLIEERILKGRKGSDYLAVFKKIAQENDFNFTPSKSFLTELQKIPKPDMEKVSECQAKIAGDLKNGLKKQNELQAVIDSIYNSGNISASSVATGILTVLDEDDFQSDLYKLRTLFLFDLLDPKSEMNFGLPTIDSTEDIDLSDGLRIQINDQNEFYVNRKKVEIEELKAKIRGYALEKESKSIITLKVGRQTQYRNYILALSTIESEIEGLREEASREIYNRRFEDLSEGRRRAILEKYPHKVVEE